MWAEVLNLGAHDLLTQPFVPREVFHVITFARHSWNSERNGDRAVAEVRMARTDAA